MSVFVYVFFLAVWREGLHLVWEIASVGRLIKYGSLWAHKRKFNKQAEVTVKC